MKAYLPGDALPGAETPRYLSHEGAQLYVVHHATTAKRANTNSNSKRNG